MTSIHPVGIRKTSAVEFILEPNDLTLDAERYFGPQTEKGIKEVEYFLAWLAGEGIE